MTFNRLIFWILLGIAILCWVKLDNIRDVRDIHSEVLRAPLQTPPLSKDNIVFQNEGFQYNLTPLYDYDLAGLVACRMDYTWFFSPKDTQEKLFPIDLCMIWGTAVRSGAYTQSSTVIKQDMRWCWFQTDNSNLVQTEIANVHLLVPDPKLKKILKSIRKGDQVRIKGKLVSLTAYSTDAKKPQQFTWTSSTSRNDTGAGACEVIYVEDIQILKKAHELYRWLDLAAKIGLLIWLGVNVIKFLRPMA